MQPVADMVDFWGRTIPSHPAVIRPEGIIGYGALAQSIETVADDLGRRLSDRSKPVAVAINDSVCSLAVSLGLLRIGFSIVPIAGSSLEPLRQIGVDTLVHEPNGAMLEGGTNIVFEDRWMVPANKAAHARPSGRRPVRDLQIKPHAIFFTSGTTGKPKPIVQTQEAWEQRVIFSNNTMFAGYERALIATGLGGAYGFNRAFEVLNAGKTACFAPSLRSMLWLVNIYEVDLMIASIQQALLLADIQEKITRFPLAALKTLRIGGSVITRDGVERIRSHLCRNVIMSYASTEAGTAAIAPYDAIAHIPGAVGYVAPGVEIEVVDHLGAVMPVGSEGFIRLRSPQFLKGPGGGEPNAWFYPGDIGLLTEDGALCIMGRTGDVVNRGGIKLSAAEIESFLEAFAGVKEAGICTHLGEAGFEEIWAAVVLEPTIDLGAFRRHVEGNPDFGGNIDKLFVVESIPRTDLGKIQPAALKEMLLGITEEPASPA